MSISNNIKRVEDRIAAACAKANRDSSEITLIAISKQKPVADIISAVKAGIQHIGENRVEEGEAKIPLVEETVQGALTWHMVGHVQSRKAKPVIQHLMLYNQWTACVWRGDFHAFPANRIDN